MINTQVTTTSQQVDRERAFNTVRNLVSSVARISLVGAAHSFVFSSFFFLNSEDGVAVEDTIPGWKLFFWLTQDGEDRWIQPTKY